MSSQNCFPQFANRRPLSGTSLCGPSLRIRFRIVNRHIKLQSVLGIAPEALHKMKSVTVWGGPFDLGHVLSLIPIVSITNVSPPTCQSSAPIPQGFKFRDAGEPSVIKSGVHYAQRTDHAPGT